MRYGLIIVVCILVAIFATCLGDAGRGGGGGGGGGGKGRAGTGAVRVGRRKGNKAASPTPSSNKAGDVSTAAKPEGANVDTGAVAASTNVRRKCRKDSDGNCIKRKTDRSRNRNARRKKNSKRRQDVSSTPSSAPASQAPSAAAEAVASV